jgi:ferredoxin
VSSWNVDVAGSCIASGSCLGVAPGYFVRGEDGKTRAAAAEIAPDQVVLDAAASCPVEAIAIRDRETGELIEP